MNAQFSSFLRAILSREATPRSVSTRPSISGSVADTKSADSNIHSNRRRRVPQSTVNAPTAGRRVRRTRRTERLRLKEGQLRSAEADVFIRRRICIRCSRSSIAKTSAGRRGSKIQRSFVPLYPARPLSFSSFFSLALSSNRASCQFSFSGWNSGPRAIFLVAPRFAAPRRSTALSSSPSEPNRRPASTATFPWLALTYEAIAFRRLSPTALCPHDYLQYRGTILPCFLHAIVMCLFLRWWVPVMEKVQARSLRYVLRHIFFADAAIFIVPFFSIYLV